MKKLIKFLVIIIAIVLLVTLALNLKIKNIKVTGNSNAESSNILKYFITNDYDRNLCLFLIKNKLLGKKEIPLIEDYDIKLKFPNEIEIVVIEKSPILYLRADLKKVLIDDKGYITGVKDKIVNIPEVSGLNFLPPVKGEKLQINGNIDFSSIINIVTTLEKNGINIDLVDVNRNNEISLYLGKIIVKMGTFNNIDVKLNRLAKIYDKIKDNKGILDLSDAHENDPNEEYIFKKTS